MNELVTPIGTLTLRANEQGLQRIEFENSRKDVVFPGTSVSPITKAILQDAKRQLEEFFARKRKFFDLPLNYEGTEFQKSVWKELIKIPYGETVFYKDIAQKIGNFRAARAVGLANNKNQIPIIIPCHRVIGSNKSLKGYASGLKIKKWLLEHETISI